MNDPRTNRIIKLVEAASTPHERQGPAFTLCEPDAASEMQLSAWKRIAAIGDDELFARRLDAEGWSESIARRLLTVPRWSGGRTLPAWTKTLVEVLDKAASWSERARSAAEAATQSSTAASPITDARPARAVIPFEDVLLPFLAIVRERLAPKIAELGAMLSVTAQAALEDAFLVHIGRLSEVPLAGAFGRYRSRHSAAVPSGTVSADSPSRKLYLQFVADAYAGGLLDFFDEYPVLARLLSEQTDAWVRRIDNFLERFRDDRGDLVRVLLGGVDPGPLADLLPGLSDLHDGGQAVVGLQFADGRRAIYKPHSVELERAWFGLLDWLNEHTSLLPWKTLRVVGRADYGWIEFCESTECTTQAEVARYYERAGMLLALLHLLQGTDCHHENIIASGEHPVLIDVETLLYPRVVPDLDLSDSDATRRSMEQLDQSVLATGLLPMFQLSPDGVANDMGGLTAGSSEVRGQTRVWTHVNTDAMALEQQPVTLPPGSNLPRLDGSVVPIDGHEEEALTGFRRLMQWCLKHRTQLLAEDGPLDAFRGVRMRYIFRNTKVYLQVLHESLRPRCLRSPAERFVQLEALSRPLLGETRLRPLWPILADERKSLERMDVPLFGLRSDVRDLPLRDGVVSGCFAASGWEHVVTTLSRIDPEEVERQVRLITFAFYARTSRLAGDMTRLRRIVYPELPSTADHDTQRNSERGVDPRFLQAALEIADRLAKRGVRGDDDTAQWITPAFIAGGSTSFIRPMELGLYDGLAGVALFLAAAGRVADREDLRKLAESAFRSITKVMSVPQAGRRLGRRIGLGAGNGLASIVYGLTVGSRFLEDDRLLDAAVQCAELITPDIIASDQTLDVMGGSAGALLALLNLADATGERRWVERAADAGNRLLATAIPMGGGGIGWRTMDRVLSGFSHGASGIACALGRLGLVRGDERCLTGARDGVRFENSLFDPTASNWNIVPAENREPEDEMRAAWCYGAPGIGLSRLDMLTGQDPPLSAEELRRDIDAAVAGTLAADWRERDHICCGNFGRLELLWEGGRRLNQPDWQDAALKKAERLLRRAADEHGFQLLEEAPSEAWFPSLFMGEAGIGYQLLRLAAPAQVPSILLWDVRPN